MNAVQRVLAWHRGVPFIGVTAASIVLAVIWGVSAVSQNAKTQPPSPTPYVRSDLLLQPIPTPFTYQLIPIPTNVPPTVTPTPAYMSFDERQRVIDLSTAKIEFAEGNTSPGTTNNDTKGVTSADGTVRFTLKWAAGRCTGTAVADGGSVRSVEFDPCPYEMDLSPDGAYLAYYRDIEKRTPTLDRPNRDFVIHDLRDDSEHTVKTSVGGTRATHFLIHPKWSPSGRFVSFNVYTRERDQNWLYDTATGTVTNVEIDFRWPSAGTPINDSRPPDESVYWLPNTDDILLGFTRLSGSKNGSTGYPEEYGYAFAARTIFTRTGAIKRFWETGFTQRIYNARPMDHGLIEIVDGCPDCFVYDVVTEQRLSRGDGRIEADRRAGITVSTWGGIPWGCDGMFVRAPSIPAGTCLEGALDAQWSPDRRTLAIVRSDGGKPDTENSRVLVNDFKRITLIDAELGSREYDLASLPGGSNCEIPYLGWRDSQHVTIDFKWGCSGPFLYTPRSWN